ncbi:MAG: hypothetical protein KGI75_25875, partial [Rhizobiaceae bacterium]|nr:hypothetical protein [Rhizobiaceae bacterium]
MAEKQLAYRASGNDEFFADDDPLAELARIVGFEPRPAAQAAPAAQRQEPAFDLEDELLREFERYDAPRLRPADDTPVSPEDQPFAGEALLAVPANDSIPQRPVEAPVAEPRRTEPKFAELPQPVAPPKPSMGARDLIDELEMSIAPAPQPVAPKPQATAPVPPAPKIPQSAAATVKLPLAHFTTSTQMEARVQAKPAPQAGVEPPVTQSRPVEPVPVFDEPVMQAAPQPEPVTVRSAAPVARVPEPIAPASMDAAALSAEIDDLLDDIDRYPVPSRGPVSEVKVEPSFDVFDMPQPVALQPAMSQPVAAPAAKPQQHAPVSIDLEADDPFAGQDFEFDLADIEMELAELDFAETSKPAPQPAPVAAKPVPVAPAPAPAVSRTIPVAPVSQALPMSPTISADTTARASVTLSPAAPRVTPAQPRPEPVVERPAPAPVAAAPVARKPEPAFDAEQALPFDPTEISETEERVENFEGSHVPNLPPVEQGEPIAVSPEYDFDIDAEMASLFGTPAKETAPEPIKPAAAAVLGSATTPSWSKNAAPRPVTTPVAKPPVEEFDEFERAMEEDYRRSYREAASPVENVARMTLNPAADIRRRPARSFRGMATAAAVIAVLGLGAYGVYGWVRHGSPIASFSGEPRVITADADPVKVAPENPGGTVVPNQDKAVYDRVAGDSTAAPKQKELVSSNEQPVDVVQKTLIPEAVSPDDGSGDQVTPTPVGETEDPRLLPDQNGNNANTAAANDDGQVPSVSPRKVRTMIVKPDGSLVAREDPAVDNTTTAASPASTLKTGSTKPATNNNQVASADLAPPTTNTQTANTQAPATTSTQAPDGDSANAESTPIRVVKTTPVPSARPAQQPTKTVPAATTDNAAAARPVPAQTQPKAQPQQVASASPAAAQATPAASASASGAYGVQIASLPSQEEAQRSQANLKVKFASVIGGHPLEIRKADIA